MGDFDGVGFPVVVTTLLPGTPAPAVLIGCEALADGLLWPADGDVVWVGAVMLLLGGAAFPLLEISTAMIATMPMAAAPMPANKKVRLLGLRGPGPRSGPF